MLGPHNIIEPIDPNLIIQAYSGAFVYVPITYAICESIKSYLNEKLKTLIDNLSKNDELTQQRLAEIRELENILKDIQGKMSWIEFEIKNLDKLIEMFEELTERAVKLQLDYNQYIIVNRKACQKYLETVFNKFGLEFIKHNVDVQSGEFIEEPYLLPCGKIISKRRLEEIYNTQSQPMCPYTNTPLPPRLGVNSTEKGATGIQQLLKDADLLDWFKDKVITYFNNNCTENENMISDFFPENRFQLIK